MNVLTSQITDLSTVCSTSKLRINDLLGGLIYRVPVNSPHKGASDAKKVSVS